jgi:hypothetical protein
MLAKRGVETKGFWGLAFNSLYWRLSDFGQSFGKPACWWGASIGLFAFLNTALIQIAAPQLCSTIAGRGETLIFSVTLSLKNSLPLLGSLFRAVPAPDDFEGWFQRYYNPLGQNHPAAVDWLVGLGVLQAIFGGVLLFLFLLALRNRFRLK